MFVVVGCTREFEFDEGNPSELVIVVELILDERLETVQSDDDCVWELLIVELFDNEVELKLVTIVDEDGGEVPSAWD